MKQKQTTIQKLKLIERLVKQIVKDNNKYKKN